METQYREQIHYLSEHIARLNRKIARLERGSDQSQNSLDGLSDKGIPPPASNNDTSRHKLPSRNKPLPPIYMVTPTYARWTQKADLTRLAQTLMHVPNLHWIVVEDSEEKTKLVTSFLLRHKQLLKSTHLNVRTERSQRYYCFCEMRTPLVYTCTYTM